MNIRLTIVSYHYVQLHSRDWQINCKSSFCFNISCSVTQIITLKLTPKNELLVLWKRGLNVENGPANHDLVEWIFVWDLKAHCTLSKSLKHELPIRATQKIISRRARGNASGNLERRQINYHNSSMQFQIKLIS